MNTYDLNAGTVCVLAESVRAVFTGTRDHQICKVGYCIIRTNSFWYMYVMFSLNII